MASLSPSNADRVGWAQEALVAFMNATRCDFEDSLGDLLCDLMHWADANQFDFEAALFRARFHHEAEIEEAKGGQ